MVSVASLLLGLLIPIFPCAAAEAGGTFTRLLPLEAPKIIDSAVPYPGNHYLVKNLVDGNPATEYSSDSKGTNTFIVFDFGSPKSIAAFRHTDRKDPATIATSELSFMDADGRVVKTVAVTHANTRGGVTFLNFPAPITAQRLKWRVTGLGPQHHGTVGGAELAFFATGSVEPAPQGIKFEVKPLPLVERKGDKLVQTLRLALDYPYAEPVEARVRIEGAEPQSRRLIFGTQHLEVAMPAVEAERSANVAVEIGGKTVAGGGVTLKPARQLVIHLLPHSHVDIGYTALQADVEKKQNENIEIGMRLIEATKNYPEGSRFKWNVEVLWPVENYLRQATPEKRAAFIDAVRAGRVGLDGFYCNILAGLCRPEELIRLMTYGTKISEQCGVPIESAMISDVPGYTWSTVSAMAQADIRYFSFAPNYFDRMGRTMVEWQNKPFWWKGPDGRSRVLCWCPTTGYALGHVIGDGPALARYLPEYLLELETKGYPYDLTHLRWNVHGDNGSPDEKIADVVRDWNARYAWPRLVISTTAATFREFERRYGDKLPEYSGDYTPYWEDGAASSARETALNRASADRLVQAEAIWSMRNLKSFPVEKAYAAWRNVLLYSEHTWGAHNSISQPDLPFVLDQWKVKQAFALDADRQSRELLGAALAGDPGDAVEDAVDVYNTSSAVRNSSLVTIPRELSKAGDRVLREGSPVLSQRLSSGELVFHHGCFGGYSAARYQIAAGSPSQHMEHPVTVEGTTLVSPNLRVTLDEDTGAIRSLRYNPRRGQEVELVQSNHLGSINEYLYLPGSDVKKVRRNSKPRITVKEKGPLVASLLVQADAPGCKGLTREVRLVFGYGYEHIEIINTVDKTAVREKEGIHFGFPFNVPNGTARMDVGWAVVRPELDQIPAACKNWFSVQRYVDISNDNYGVLWLPLDAPLVEVGGLTANLVGSQTNPNAWIEHLEPSQSIYSWVMNNHWHTNYRAEQDGPTTFRYVIYPHPSRYYPAQVDYVAAGFCEPLVVARAFGKAPAKARLWLTGQSGETVRVTALKPSDDGKALIARLYGAGGKDERIKLNFSEPKPARLWLSDTSERPLKKLGAEVAVPAWGIVTVRAELP